MPLLIFLHLRSSLYQSANKEGIPTDENSPKSSQLSPNISVSRVKGIIRCNEKKEKHLDAPTISLWRRSRLYPIACCLDHNRSQNRGAWLRDLISSRPH